MKTLITLSIFIVSFLFTSCYTQFATVKENDDYVVKRERTYQKYEKPDDSEDTYYEEEQDQYLSRQGSHFSAWKDRRRG